MKYIITESQYKLIIESIPVKLRRRVNFNDLKQELLLSVLPMMEISDYDSLNDFTVDACDMLKDILLEDFEDTTPKERDDLYYFLVDHLSKYLKEVYEEMKINNYGL